MQVTVRKNLWKIFFILLFIASLFLGVSLSFRYNEITTKLLSRLEYAEETLYQGLSIFDNYQTILDATGRMIHKKNLSLENKEDFMSFLQKVVAVDPFIMGFGLADTNGDLILTNKGLSPKKVKNLKQNPRTKESFELTLKSDQMIIGDPYYIAALNTWVLPLRKAIRDKNGNVVWIMTLGLDLEKLLDGFPRIKDKIFISILLKDKSWVRIFRSGIPKEHFHDFFGKPMLKSTMAFIEETVKRYGYNSLDDLRFSQKPETFKFYIPNTHHTAYSRVRYVARYNLWTTVAVYKDVLWKRFIPILLSYITVFAVVIGLLFLLFRKISKLETKRFEELEYQATHDPLTKLPNRLYMREVGEEWIQNQKEFCILFLDLDNFKNINDTMGHKIGDEILIEVTKRIEKTLQEHTKLDTLLMRHGGDEFIVFCHTKEIYTIEKLAYSILKAIAKPYFINGSEFILSGSIGISRYPDDGQTLDELLSASDIAMYKAKELKNSFEHFSSKLIENKRRALEIEHHLRHALERDELYMNYQPQISSDMKFHGVEALLRWNNPILGEVSPAEFIPVAEKCGLISDIGRFVIDRSLREIKNLQERLSCRFEISINVSTKQFAEHNFVQNAYNNVKDIAFDHSLICVEITESLLIDNLEYILDELHSINEFDIQISMDDFGTGYSSLHMLQTLPIDELKVDKSFVDNMLEERSATLMVKTILNLAQILELRTVAEGVEHKEQVLKLKELGCDIFQGYYFAKPMGIEELEKFIKEESWKDKL